MKKPQKSVNPLSTPVGNSYLHYGVLRGGRPRSSHPADERHVGLPPIPADTAIDARGNLSEDTKTLMKMLYLGWPVVRQFIREGVSPTDAINAAEELRERGLIKVVIEAETEGAVVYRIEPTSLPATKRRRLGPQRKSCPGKPTPAGGPL